MKNPSLPLDDLPERATLLDRLLRLRLGEAAGKYFYNACDRTTQTLLSTCKWQIMTDASILTPAINCHDKEAYWCILSGIPQLGSRLTRFVNQAKIQINPPVGEGRLLEIRVDIGTDDE